MLPINSGAAARGGNNRQSIGILCEKEHMRLEWHVSRQGVGMRGMTHPLVNSIDPIQPCVLCAGYSLQAVVAWNEVRRAERRHE